MNSGAREPWSDPIIDAVRQVRERYAATFQFDLSALYQDLKAQEAHSDSAFVTYPPRTTSPAAPLS